MRNDPVHVGDSGQTDKVAGVQRSVMASLIGAVLGLVYILVNASKVPDTPAITLRVLAILVFVAVYLAIRHVPAPEEFSAEGDSAADRVSTFDRQYWTIAAIEFLIGVAGIAIIAGPLHHEEASVAWISLVVGVNFLSLAQTWRQPGIAGLGGVIAICGMVGLVLAFGGASDESVASLGGILPGAILLGASWWAANRSRRELASRNT